MATSRNDAELTLGLNDSDLTTGLERSQAALKDAADRMKQAFDGPHEAVGSLKGAFEGLASPILRLQGLFAGLVAVVSGAAFAVAIDESKKLTGEATRLAAALGINTAEASALNTALGDIGADAETYTGALGHFAKQLKSNEDGLKAMGLQTRDANGHLRDTQTLFSEALGDVSQYKAGLDQTTASMTYFGRSVEDARKLQKLNSDVIDEARKKNEALGLTITKNNVAATKEYKSAMNDLGDVMSALKKTIGDAVMPVFTDLAKLLSDWGPAAVAVMRTAIEGIVATIRIFGLGITLLYDWFKGAFRGMTDMAMNFGKVMSHLLKWEFAEAWEAAKKTWTDHKGNLKEMWAEMVADTESANKKIAAAVSGDSSGGTMVGKSGSKTMGDFKKTNGGPKEADKSRMSAWEAELAQLKVALERQALEEGKFREMSKAEELAFWQAKKGRRDLNDSEAIAAARKVADTELAIMKEGFEQKVAALQADSAAYRANTEAKIAIERQIQALYQEGSKGYAEAQKRINEINLQANAQALTIARSRADAARQIQLGELNAEQADAKLLLDLKRITNAQYLQIQRELEDRRYAIQQEALTQQRTLLEAERDRDAVKIDQVNRQLEALEAAHQERIGQIRAQATMEQQRYATSYFNSVQSGLQNLLQGIANGTIKMSNILQSAFQMLYQATTSVLSQIASEYLMSLIKGKLFAMTDGLAKIQANAAVAGSAAFAAIVGIPYVGPALAPAAAAEAYASTMAFASALPMAAQGWDIPGGLNPVAQLHEREMVLPAKQADVIRNMADGGGGGGGHTFVFQSLDSADVEAFVRKHDTTIAGAVASAHRNGWRPT